MYINEAIVKAIAKYGETIYIYRRSIQDMYVKADLFSPVWKYHKSGQRMSSYCLTPDDLLACDWDVYHI